MEIDNIDSGATGIFSSAFGPYVNEIHANFKIVPTSSQMGEWLFNNSTNGTFYKPKNMDFATAWGLTVDETNKVTSGGSSYTIPNGWTIVNVE